MSDVFEPIKVGTGSSLTPSHRLPARRPIADRQAPS